MLKKFVAILTIFNVLIISLVVAPSETKAVAPLVKFVAGETADQVLQGIAYKAGANLNSWDYSAKDVSRARWNLEAYEKAKQFESQLDSEEKARWDKFKTEVETAKIEPHPTKKGWGKVALSSIAFLTGLDLVYNSVTAFQNGYNNNSKVDVQMHVANDTYAIGFVQISDRRYEFHIATTEGTYTWQKDVGGKPVTAKAYTFPEKNNSNVEAYGGGAYDPYGYTVPGILLQASDNPMNTTVSPTVEMAKLNRPSAFGTVPNVPGSTNVPDLNIPELLPNVAPDTMIEIEVPLNYPHYNPPTTEIPEPLSPAEWATVTTPKKAEEPAPGEEPGKGEEGAPIKEGDFEKLGCVKPEKVSFEPVGSAFSNAFPFSIPWDLKRFFDESFDSLSTAKPQFKLGIFGENIYLKIPDYFDKWMSFGKTIIIVLFDISILYMFYRFMKGGGN